MMTPDRESCRGVLSRQRSLNTTEGAWFHDKCMGPLSFVGRIGAGRDAARELVRISTALSEIVVGTVAHMIVGVIRGTGGLAAPHGKMNFLAARKSHDNWTKSKDVARSQTWASPCCASSAELGSDNQRPNGRKA